MSEWLEISVNSSLCEGQFPRWFLIKVPKSDWKFCHPFKMVTFSGKNNYRMTIEFPRTWTFRCFKRGKGKHNKYKVVDYCNMTVAEMIEHFRKLPEFGDLAPETQPVKSNGFPILKDPTIEIKPNLKDEI